MFGFVRSAVNLVLSGGFPQQLREGSRLKGLDEHSVIRCALFAQHIGILIDRILVHNVFPSEMDQAYIMPAGLSATPRQGE